MNFSALHILHCANYEQFKYGSWFMNVDMKFHHGLIRNGHHVQAFSQRDVARSENPFKNKKMGSGVANRRLFEMVENFQPDILLLGHSELITEKSLIELRQRYPQMKVAMWWVDPIYIEKNLHYLKMRAQYCDVIFTTTGGKLLEEIASAGCVAAHIPNPVDSAVERYRAFENSPWEHDLFFAGSDYNEPERAELLLQLRDNHEGLRFRIHQALGAPRIHGADYYNALSSCRMGLSLSRRFDVDWYSSDRLAQLMGNGLVTFSPKTAGLTKLFGENDLVWFDDYSDLEEKIDYYQNNIEAGLEIAQSGWEQAHLVTNADRITKFMIEVIENREFSERYQWAEEVYGK
ncbi:glycosyltransferase [Persicirhabdus sediminis]|uniref:Glycosyltransferase n=1 Tax=Persicirhabdus sediminis TaxID=454144 RepID=A0A8J7MDI8_9BACT|nr:glycosyltransferase [Persicirhabdus sediminis]MBK1790528.1 glycosyltransferase [Persicirhabdus sediminis]